MFERLATVPDKESFLAEAALGLSQELQADASDILLTQSGGGLVLKASTWRPDFIDRVRLGKGVGLVGKACEDRATIFCKEGVERHERFRHVPEYDETEYTSGMAVPMLTPTGQCLGVVYLRKRDTWTDGEADIPVAQAAVRELTLFWMMFKAGMKAGSQRDKLAVLSEVTRVIGESPYLEEILQLLVNMTAQRFNFRVVTVRLLDESRQELILRATQATNRAYQRKRAIKLGESIAGRAITEKRSVWVQNVQSDPDYIGHDLAEEQGLKSMVCVPLTIQGRTVGVMSCYTDVVREFPQDEIDVLETLAKQAAVSIEHAKLQVRSTLMQEMHHRVKNNLQQVASLLRLQMGDESTKSPVEALTDSLGRILAIAAVHELLSREDLDHVSIRQIAEMLTQHQQQSFILPGKTVAFSVRGDDVYLNTTQATQISLILNETIQNAVEHGFHTADHGDIHVTVEELEGGLIGVWVSNNGDPLGPDFDPTKKGRLGLKIIRSLAKGLGGTFVIEDRLGWTVCEVTFPRTAAE